jgi:hypothetical protein
MKLAINIQHVPGRERWAETMRYMLADRRVTIQTDDKRDLWEGCKKVLTNRPKGTTHVLVLQDDILPCRDFISTVERIINLLPGEVITYFSTRQTIGHPLNLGLHYLKLKTWRMAQAYSAPVEVIDDFIAWADRHIKPEIYFDDDRWAMYCFYNNRWVWATAPSLVEHLGWNQTTLGGGYKPQFRLDLRKKASQRMAEAFVGYENSPKDIEWENLKAIEDNEGTYAEFIHNYIK